MSSIIVFSKDRPMQLHAYLESLIWASGCSERQIHVLYREVMPISYYKVKKYFPNVHWIAEECFRKQLQDTITHSDEYIMFGCDDVLFVDHFNFDEMESYLSKHNEVFGFSVRLGKNIGGMPKKNQKEGKYCAWDWTKAKSHYGYPWELDCTLYRKQDVLKIIEKIETERLKSPNYLESVPEEKPQEYIQRKGLATYYEKSKAIVITVNRVQETHPNGIDDSKITDPVSLFIKYHYEDRILDLKSIRQLKHNKVHVDSTYFQLTPSVGQDTEEEKVNGWKRILDNVRFISTNNLGELFKRNQQSSSINARLQTMDYSIERPRVLGPCDTVGKLCADPRSFSRFGDGEFTLMLGESIGFQKYEPKLALRLWEIFCEDNNNLYIGVPYQQFQLPDNFNQWIREFYYTSGSWIRAFLNKYLIKRQEAYIDTGFNQVYQTYSSMNFADYYEKVRNLFQGRKLAIIAGKDILSKLDYNVFDLAESVEYVDGPAKNAFSCYSEILNNALQLERDRLICVILGPTSKLLAADLTKAGYMVWDIGHLAKDYDAYRKRICRTKEEIGRFYAPD